MGLVVAGVQEMWVGTVDAADEEEQGEVEGGCQVGLV